MADNEQAMTDELTAARDRVAELEEEKQVLTRQLESGGLRITGLEQAVADRDGELAVLKETVVKADQELTGVGNSLAQAVESYQAQVAAANPDVPAELITGGTIDAVNESLENARSLVDKVKLGIEAEASRVKVPAGAPQRAPLDLSVLSPREKIQYAIGGNR
ncbi:MAG: hypothetical protein V3R92_03195 [Dehalococcoidales bacterium]